MNNKKGTKQCCTRVMSNVRSNEYKRYNEYTKSHDSNRTGRFNSKSVTMNN